VASGVVEFVRRPNRTQADGHVGCYKNGKITCTAGALFLGHVRILILEFLRNPTTQNYQTNLICQVDARICDTRCL